MRTVLILTVVAVTAMAQVPYKLDEAFFNGDRAKVLREVTDRARSMKNGDAKLLAEYGRAYLAALDVPKGKEVLRLAEAKEPKDGAVLRLIALAWLKNGFKSEALSAYEQVLRRDPKNKEALAQSGIDLAEVGLVNSVREIHERLSGERARGLAVVPGLRPGLPDGGLPEAGCPLVRPGRCTETGQG